MEATEENIAPLTPTRIAIYDDLLSAPRIVDVEPKNISQYIEEIASKTYEFSQQKGGSIPYSVIRQVCENFIHAHFKDSCISILDDGNTIKFTDQGPGIADKQKAQLPGFSTATTEMRKFINGVGSGFPTVREYLRFSNGRLIIEDNIKEGTVVTIQVDERTSEQSPVVYQESSSARKNAQQEISEREYNILALAQELGLVGPTELEQNLGISLATGSRELKKLEKLGFLKKTPGGTKRMMTDKGLSFLNG